MVLTTNLPTPYLYPTQNNGICAEWPIGGNEASVDFSVLTYQGEWIGFNDDDAESVGSDFDTPEAWDLAGRENQVDGIPCICPRSRTNIPCQAHFLL